MSDIIKVYIGFDANECRAWDVCASSILANTNSPVDIVRLDQKKLRMAGVYRRQFYTQGDQHIDVVDNLPFSTAFSFSRFLVPALTLWTGHAIFVDSDFLFRDDIAKIWEMRDDTPLRVAKSNFHPKNHTKMRGNVVQSDYPRKLWSSLMLFNCAHPKIMALTPYQVNFFPGSYLHQVAWLDDKDIGILPCKWNWVPGASDQSLDPSAIHYTSGTPDVPGHHNEPYAKEWLSYGNK